MKYHHCLLDCDLSELQLLSDDRRVHAMKSLAIFSKFTGGYSQWKELVQRYGLKWGNRSSLRAFVSILNFKIDDTKEWLLDVIQKLPEDYALAEVFICLTGLRINEALESLRLIPTQSEDYIDKELGMLQHFRFRQFLRGSKNTFISFISNELLERVLEVKPDIRYEALYTKIRRLGYRNKSKELRKLFATTLRNNGIPSEIIDIVQGRISSSIFLRFYYRPFLKETRHKVMNALGPLERELLSEV